MYMYILLISYLITVVFFLCRYEGELVTTAPDGTSHTFRIKFEDILAFSTGAPVEPPLGFQPSPVLSFQSDSPFPRANTCSNTLYIALQSMGDDVFMYFMCYGILGSAGFGMI